MNIDMDAVSKNAAAAASLRLAMGQVQALRKGLPVVPLPRLDPSPDDDRDYPFVPLETPIFRQSDMRPSCTAIEQQSNLGSCTGQATVGACEYFMNREKFFTAGLSDLSPLAVYKMARDRDGIMGDNGANLRSALQVARKLGVPRETTVPYLIDRYDDALTDAAVAEALKQKLTRFERIDPKDKNVHRLLKAALSEKLPVVMAGWVFEWLRHLTGTLPNHKIIRADPSLSGVIGAHAQVIVGFSNWRGQYIVRNSWGPEWGYKGYWGMLTADVKFAFEFYVVRSFHSDL